ncbi:GGDEF domain-containing protein [Qipengyuania sp.]|uniref:GGDEF domain-containing protein n=1 Tax=Qipengyuania sp. TaxID=2004515 RepID=UPI003515342D
MGLPSDLEPSGEIAPPEQAKVQRAILQAVVDTEQRSVLANLLCWVIAAVAAFFLPTAQYFVFPLVFRLVAMVGTRTAFAQVRSALRDNLPLLTKLRWLAAALFVGGAAWGSTLLPVMAHPTLHPARLLVGGGTLIGMSIIITMLSSVPRMALSFAAGFLGAFGGGLWSEGAHDALELTAGMAIILLIFIAYSHASTYGQTQSAQLLVENRRLGKDLRASLEGAMHMAEHDELTGLLNRRAFFSYAELTEWTPRVVAMIDIDHFKAINDRFGHAVGDAVLERVGRAMRDVLERDLGDQSLAARLGGEEFAVMMPDRSDSEARKTIDALRKAIAAVGPELEAPGLVTTASAGVARLDAGQTLDEALHHADAALYLAKAKGRDRTEWAAPQELPARRPDRTGLVRRRQR